jgi:imidazolonepropionase-like amidohydrolase
VFTQEQIQALADMGAYTEIVFNMMMPRLSSLDPADYIDLAKAIGAEKMIMGTDLAQCMDPTPAEGMRFFIGTLLQFGCTPEEIMWMAKINPSKLLDVE